jgi:hypothetical protein
MRVEPALFDVGFAELRSAIEALRPHGATDPRTDLAFSPALSKALQRAVTYAYARGEDVIEPIHLAMSMLDFDDGSLAAVFRTLSRDMEGVKARLVELASPVVPPRGAH